MLQMSQKMKVKRAGKEKPRNKASAFQILVLIYLSILTLSFICLFFWGFITSLKDNYDFYYNKLSFPNAKEYGWAFSNYPAVFKEFYYRTTDKLGNPYTAGVPQMIINTLINVLASGLLGTAMPFLMAYLNAKFPNKFSKVVYAFVIVAMLLPLYGAGASELQLSRLLGLYNTRWGLPLMRGHFLGMYFLIMCASFKGVPKEVSEAAYVDGASEFRTMVQIVMPLVMNVFGVVFLLQCVGFWNEYGTALIYQPSFPTLGMGLYNALWSLESAMSFVPMRMAACFLLVIPIFVLFLIFSDKMMGKLQVGGLKE